MRESCRFPGATPDPEKLWAKLHINYEWKATAYPRQAPQARIERNRQSCRIRTKRISREPSPPEKLVLLAFSLTIV